ncbi:MAG TPA: alpha/beta hydrolase [Smithellaceae bacterium]|nr:alpha/beta hydrolase [Smithellaceae bacterium]HRS89743.1 alpha/beta hydrolase [Smithellaceae bacterium]HRV26600.1 alpha/beta hydrolase [Smithellaceae bacterium]
MNRAKYKILFLCLFTATFISGCRYLSITPEDDTVALSKGKERMLVYNCAVVKGRVVSSDVVKNPTLLVAYPLTGDDSSLSDYVVLNSTSPFMLYLSEGRYHLYAITDFNNDGVYTEKEVSGYFGFPSAPREISLRKEDLVKGIVINTSRENSKKISFPQPLNIDERQAISQLTYSGQVTKIYDERFSLENASAGWWNPSVFMRAFGARIYFTQEYDPEKIPVLFVHGAEGSPQNWVYFFMRLDHRRYQPWFFYYPSGIHLSLASHLLYDELMELHAQYGFKKMCIVAHSIGGLVTRSLLTRYKFKDNFVKVYVTLATPWSGFEMADVSQRRKHKSLPSWMDIGTQSVFIRRTLNAKLPGTISYYLFYGKEDDVSAGRALDDRVLLRAKDNFGFDCNHDTILSDRLVFRKFSEILEKEFQ